MFPLHYLLSLVALLAKTIILLRFVTCKNPTYSIAQCQYIFEVEDFHSKHCMDEVYAVLKTSVNYHQFILGSNSVWFLNIANITLISLWAVASTAIL